MEEAQERVEAQIQADLGMENQNQDNTLKKEDKDKEKTTFATFIPLILYPSQVYCI